MQLPDPSSVTRVAVVGCGTIGASWAAHFLGRGMAVQAWDPAPGAEGRLRAFVDDAWPALARLGLAPGATRDRLSFHPDAAGALALDHFGGAIEAWWRDMREVSLDAASRARLADSVEEGLAGRSYESLAAERDRLLLATMESLARVRRAGDG